MAPPCDLRAIAGVKVRPLAVLADARGAVMHMLRADDPHFDRFGEIYFSLVHPGAVKAWRRHRTITLNYAVPVGAIRLAVFDVRPGSLTEGAVGVLETGASSYALVTIPPGLWSGFVGLGTTPSLVANCATGAHDPAEADRRAPDDQSIPYVW